MLTQAIVASITVVAIVGKWTGKDFWGEGRTVRARIYHSPDQASTPAREPAASPSSIWSWTIYGSMISVPYDPALLAAPTVCLALSQDIVLLTLRRRGLASSDVLAVLFARWRVLTCFR
jgi:hypothetical protein